jgi:hypothetical protein
MILRNDTRFLIHRAVHVSYFACGPLAKSIGKSKDDAHNAGQNTSGGVFRVFMLLMKRVRCQVYVYPRNESVLHEISTSAQSRYCAACEFSSQMLYEQAS